MLTKKIMIFLFGIFLTFSSVISLECYVCDEYDGDDCRSGIKESMIKTCDKKPYGVNGTFQDATGCSILVSAQKDLSAPKSLRRGCFYRKITENNLFKDGCHSTIATIYTPYNCTVCEGNLCNGVSSFLHNQINPISMLLMTISSIFFVKYFL